MKRPSFQFYPQDWLGDTDLRCCSIEARGLWIDILGLMHEAEPYGHLIVNGKSPSTRQLAAMLGGTVKEIETLLDELAEADVFSRTDDGVIFSRRMVRDRDRSEEGRQWIEKRWKDKRAASKPKSPPGREPSSPPNRGPTATPITQKPEARFCF